MKIALWSVFGLLLVLWTGGAWVAAALTAWGADLIASGGVAELGRMASKWPVPPWMAPWVDTAWIQAAQQAFLWSMDSLGQALPWMGSAVGWLQPFIWMLWGVGAIVLAGLAGFAHLMLGRMRSLQTRPA